MAALATLLGVLSVPAVFTDTIAKNQVVPVARLSMVAEFVDIGIDLD